MAKAKQLPSGRWNVQITCGRDENGKQIRISCTADTKEEAELLAAQRKSEAKQGASDRAHNRIKLSKAMEEYIESCRVTGASPATLRGYMSILNNLGDFGNYIICDMNTRDLQRMVNTWSKRNAPKTVENKMTLVFSTLESYDIWPKRKAVRMPKKEDEEMVIPQDEDVQRLLNAARKDRNLYIAVLLAATMGLRRSELCALTWKDVDFSKHALYIDKAVVRGDDNLLHTKGTKTKSGKRILPISDAVLEELKPFREIDGPVITCKPWVISDRYARLRDTLNIPGRFHDLRHYTCSVMAALGVSELYSVKYMGHASNDSVHRTYEHVLNAKAASVSNALNDHTDRLVSGEAIEY